MMRCICLFLFAACLAGCGEAEKFEPKADAERPQTSKPAAPDLSTAEK